MLASFNQGYKLTRTYVEMWLDTLARHDDAVLWLSVAHLPARANLRAAVARNRSDAFVSAEESHFLRPDPPIGPGVAEKFQDALAGHGQPPSPA